MLHFDAVALLFFLDPVSSQTIVYFFSSYFLVCIGKNATITNPQSGRPVLSGYRKEFLERLLADGHSLPPTDWSLVKDVTVLLLGGGVSTEEVGIPLRLTLVACG